jgi:hypothetical protein
MAIPKSLKTWFTMHFVVDYIFAIPLLLIPEHFLRSLGWSYYDPFASAIVAGSLFAIGGVSFLHRKAGHDVYKTMLQLKLIWSWFVIIGVGMNITSSSNLAEWAVLSIFAVFFVLWGYYYMRYFRE